MYICVHNWCMGQHAKKCRVLGFCERQLHISVSFCAIQDDSRLIRGGERIRCEDPCHMVFLIV